MRVLVTVEIKIDTNDCLFLILNVRRSKVINIDEMMNGLTKIKNFSICF